MKVINDIEVLKQFEIHHLGIMNEVICNWNPLSKEFYESLKQIAFNSYSNYTDKNKNTILNKHEINAFYSKRITERNSWDARVLLAEELLPENILRDIYLNHIDTFTLLHSGDIYIGVLSIKKYNGIIPFSNKDFLKQIGIENNENIMILNEGHKW